MNRSASWTSDVLSSCHSNVGVPWHIVINQNNKHTRQNVQYRMILKSRITFTKSYFHNEPALTANLNNYKLCPSEKKNNGNYIISGDTMITFIDSIKDSERLVMGKKKMINHECRGLQRDQLWLSPYSTMSLLRQWENPLSSPVCFDIILAFYLSMYLMLWHH